jgi:hypothetical protein
MKITHDITREDDGHRRISVEYDTDISDDCAYLSFKKGKYDKNANWINKADDGLSWVDIDLSDIGELIETLQEIESILEENSGPTTYSNH